MGSYKKRFTGLYGLFERWGKGGRDQDHKIPFPLVFWYRLIR